MVVKTLYLYLCVIINQQKQNAMNKELTFTEIQETLEHWIMETNFDLQQDWNEEKEKMQMQLQCLLVAKFSLDNIKNLGGQFFSSSIKK